MNINYLTASTILYAPQLCREDFSSYIEKNLYMELANSIIEQLSKGKSFAVLPISRSTERFMFEETRMTYTLPVIPLDTPAMHPMLATTILNELFSNVEIIPWTGSPTHRHVHAKRSMFHSSDNIDLSIDSYEVMLHPVRDGSKFYGVMGKCGVCGKVFVAPYDNRS